MTIRFDLAAPYEVEETDMPFARPQGADLLARIYRPRGEPAAPLAALVDAHGGAWARLDRTAGAIYGRALAACGLIVVAVDFRQGPDHKHPAASADVAAGVRYVRAHARRLGADPGRIGLVGSSSGAQLALLVAITPGDHAGTPIVLPDGSLGSGRGDDSVAFALAVYPVADPLARFRYVLSRAEEPGPASGFDAKRLIASHRGYFADEAAMAAASVTRIVAAGEARALPPVWVAQAELDDNVPAAITEAFVRAYREAGGAIEHVLFPGARHGFMQQTGADTDKCIALMREFVGRQLGQV
ncbi:MAG TPA: alpha/beta hydrolase [Methylomirabilota bacterium]|nr:alpha/beta hydrolase [Methylomirabilota bacterium]